MIRFCSGRISLATDPRADQKRELAREQPSDSCYEASAHDPSAKYLLLQGLLEHRGKGPSRNPRQATRDAGEAPHSWLCNHGQGFKPCLSFQAAHQEWPQLPPTATSGGCNPTPGEYPGPPLRGMGRNQYWMVLGSSEPPPVPSCQVITNFPWLQLLL